MRPTSPLASPPRPRSVGRSPWNPLRGGFVARTPRAAIAAAGVLTLVLAAGAAAPAAATQVRIFQTQSAVGFLGGKLSGVSVDALGRLRLAPRAERVAAIGEPFVFTAAAVHVAGKGRHAADSWVVGTGNSGKVLQVDHDGTVHELFTAPEPEVFALWADADGTVFAGTSPHGKVYRIAGGKGSVFFDPGETYIWALARDAGGKLLVATGTHGKLYRVDGAGHGEVALTADDTHLRSIAPQADGDVLVGTAGKGLILRLGKDGHARTLYQADEPEVVSLTAAPDGSTYAALVASEASLVDLGGGEVAGPAGSAGVTPPAAGAGGRPGKGGGKARGGAAGAGAGLPPGDDGGGGGGGDAGVLGSRRAGATGPRSEVVRLAADGSVQSLWSFAVDTVFSLLWQNDRLWVATGVEGKLYTYSGGQMALEEDLDERQIVTLLPGAAGPAFATTNGSALYRIVAQRQHRGTFTSAAFDAGQMARFGAFRWRGEVLAPAALRFSFRSGMSAVPDDTWSPWQSPPPSPPVPAMPQTPPGNPENSAAQSGEIPLAALPRGRFVQWRVELEGGAGDGAASPVLYGIELSYRQDNQPPRITQLTALDPGQILVPATFNPTNQVYEPAHPNRDGIFVPIGTQAADDAGGRLKPLWKRGFRTLRWSAADPNEDPLVFDLYFRPASAAETAPWIKVAGDVDDDHYSFDATVLPDGVYRFRLVASDRNANDPDAALSAERISEPVVIDQSPPTLGAVERSGRQLKVTLYDALSPIREAVYSVDAGAWKPARAADGLLDGLTETVLIDLDAGTAGASGARGTDAAAAAKGSLLLLRVTDAAYNVITFDLSRSLR